MIKHFETVQPDSQAMLSTTARYVDGFVIPLPKSKIDDYRRIAQQAGEVWRDHGALEYRECIGEDLEVKCGVTFPQLIGASPEETVVFAWIAFESRAHRDEVNAKVMKDPRLAAMMDAKAMPFDCQRMAYGGFQILVDAMTRVPEQKPVRQPAHVN